MRIGFFTSIEGWGGSEMYLRTLMRGVREAGHTPVLIGVEGSRLYREAVTDGLETVAWRVAPAARADASHARTGVVSAEPSPRSHFRLPLGLALLIGNLREAYRLARLLRTLSLDVLQVTVHGYEMAGLAARACGIPTVGVYQISPIDEPYWLRRLLIRQSARGYRHVVCVSRFSLRAWLPLLAIPAARCSVVYNGVDLAPYVGSRKAYRAEAAAPLRLVSVGRLHPMKGFRYLIEAMRELNDPRVSLTILGEGEQRGELEQCIREWKLEGVVHLAGHVEDPAPTLKNADAFVLASVDREGLPFVLGEAMAAGLPLLTSDFGPLPEINRHEETGLVVPAGNAAALAQAIRRMADHPALAAHWGQVARTQAAGLTQDRMVRAMLDLYQVLARRACR